MRCPEGAECDRAGTTVLTLPLEPGHWRSSIESAEVLECRNKEACNVNETEACLEGHRGPLCELCEGGYAPVQGSCVECEGGGSATALVGVIVV